MLNTVATIQQLFVYPVKSMRGVRLPDVFVSLNGIYGDRRYAFVQKRLADRSAFPWMTGREQPRLVTYRPRLSRVPTREDADPPVYVRAPDGDEFPVDDPRLLQRLEADARAELFLLKNARGNYDTQHLSIFNLRTLRALELECNACIDVRQFRPNLIVEGIVVAQVGEAVVAVTKKDTRCMMINLDPESGTQHPEVLRAVTRQHNQQAGIYANVLSPGIVREGDVIRIIGTTKVTDDAD
ncbi:MAG: MOSC domain-containing protein [Chloroflexi bacterium]|nr:MAG: MOSC domain-containing protein [Chloroflexota bacterium]